jgi:hypothetical protein
VLVTTPAGRVAFEVQWSSQGLDEYRRRTDRYAADGIQTVWIARTAARGFSWWELGHAFNAAPFAKGGVIREPYPRRETWEVFDAAVACLVVLARPGDGIPGDAPRIYQGWCHKCGEPFKWKRSGDAWGGKQPWTPEEARLLGRMAAKLKDSYSVTAGHRYDMWLCPWCGAKQGDFYLGQTEEPPETVANGELVADTRRSTTGRTFWDDVEDELRASGASPVSKLGLTAALTHESRKDTSPQVSNPGHELVSPVARSCITPNTKDERKPQQSVSIPPDPPQPLPEAPPPPAECPACGHTGKDNWTPVYTGLFSAAPRVVELACPACGKAVAVARDPDT